MAAIGECRDRGQDRGGPASERVAPRVGASPGSHGGFCGKRYSGPSGSQAGRPGGGNRALGGSVPARGGPAAASAAAVGGAGCQLGGLPAPESGSCSPVVGRGTGTDAESRRRVRRPRPPAVGPARRFERIRFGRSAPARRSGHLLRFADLMAAGQHGGVRDNPHPARGRSAGGVGSAHGSGLGNRVGVLDVVGCGPGWPGGLDSRTNERRLVPLSRARVGGGVTGVVAHGLACTRAGVRTGTGRLHGGAAAGAGRCRNSRGAGDQRGGRRGQDQRVFTAGAHLVRNCGSGIGPGCQLGSSRLVQARPGRSLTRPRRVAGGNGHGRAGLAALARRSCPLVFGRRGECRRRGRRLCHALGFRGHGRPVGRGAPAFRLGDRRRRRALGRSGNGHLGQSGGLHAGRRRARPQFAPAAAARASAPWGRRRLPGWAAAQPCPGGSFAVSRIPLARRTRAFGFGGGAAAPTGMNRRFSQVPLSLLMWTAVARGCSALKEVLLAAVLGTGVWKDALVAAWTAPAWIASFGSETVPALLTPRWVAEGPGRLRGLMGSVTGALLVLSVAGVVWPRQLVHCLLPMLPSGTLMAAAALERWLALNIALLG